MIAGLEHLAFEYVPNGAGQSLGQGADIQAAETVVRAGWRQDGFWINSES